MHIYGPTHLHGPQAISPPHSSRVSQPAAPESPGPDPGRTGHLRCRPHDRQVKQIARHPARSGRRDPRADRRGHVRDGRETRASPWTGSWTKSAKRRRVGRAAVPPDSAWCAGGTRGLGPPYFRVDAAMPKDYSLGSVEIKLSPLERFAQFLQSRGKRVTRQRRLIVEQVFSHHDHFDADELIEPPPGPDRPAQAQPADGLSHAGRAGRGRPDPQDDARRPQRLRARIRLPQPRPPLLPDLQPAHRVPQRRTGAHLAAGGRANTTSRSPATACSSPASAPTAADRKRGQALHSPPGGALARPPAIQAARIRARHF